MSLHERLYSRYPMADINLASASWQTLSQVHNNIYLFHVSVNIFSDFMFRVTSFPPQCSDVTLFGFIKLNHCLWLSGSFNFAANCILLNLSLSFFSNGSRHMCFKFLCSIWSGRKHADLLPWRSKSVLTVNHFVS